MIRNNIFSYLLYKFDMCMYKFYFSRYFVSQISFNSDDNEEDDQKEDKNQKKDKKYYIEVIDRYNEYDNFVDIDADVTPAKIHNKEGNQIIVE
jgi:thymidylate kinase